MKVKKLKIDCPICGEKMLDISDTEEGQNWQIQVSQLGELVSFKCIKCRTDQNVYGHDRVWAYLLNPNTGQLMVFNGGWSNAGIVFMPEKVKFT